jgi:hypothetical protein
MNELSEFINQIILEEVAPEADMPNAPFGKWFAPGQRNIATSEEDTPAEQQVITALRKFMGSNNDPSMLSANNGILANALYVLMKKHQYSPILDPGVPVAYRGISFKNEAHFSKILNMYAGSIASIHAVLTYKGPLTPINQQQVEQLIQSGSYEYFVVSLGPFSLQPQANTLVQSWTSNKTVTDNFISKEGYGGMLIRASTTKNKFFGKPGEIGKIGGFAEEMETISVGSVTTDGAVMVFSQTHVDYKTVAYYTQNL